MLNCPLNVQITEFIKLNLSLRKHADILEGTFLRPFITEYLFGRGRWYIEKNCLNKKCHLCNLNELGDAKMSIFQRTNM